MASRRDVTKKFAREYAKADRAEKSRILDALVASTGWTRDHARRAIRAAATRKGAARDQQRKPRPRKYSYDALIVLQEVWRLAGQPSGKYLAVVMEDTLCRLVRDRELGKVADRVSDTVIDELRSMSAATIDRYLKPHKAAGYPAAGLSSTRPSHILRSSIPVRAATDDPITVPGFLELDTVAHCGHTLKGEFLRTLSATDPVTGWTMLRFYASDSRKSSWEEDILGSSVLGNGRSVTINVDDGSGACVYDFKAEFTNGQVLTRMNVNVCQIADYYYTR